MAKFTRMDLEFVLVQIKSAEVGQPAIDPLLSYGLREVQGTNNNQAGHPTYGSADGIFPRVTDPVLQNAQGGTSYASTSGLVIDAQPRTISNLIADQTADNPAAVAAQQAALAVLGDGYLNTTQAGPDGILGTADDTKGPGADGILGTADDTYGNTATPTDTSNSSSTILGLQQSLFINNVTPDAGLSAPFSSWFTFFGQFFDHGVDLISKGGSGIVYMPLAADDPLVAGADGQFGTADDLPAQLRFMVLTRATNQPGPDGVLGTADDVHDGSNTITPFVDQSQTYSSHSSHQVFLREYVIGADGLVHSTGALLSHHQAGADGALFTDDDTVSGQATWLDLKLNAIKYLGIILTDKDVGNVPLLATDAYGNLLLHNGRVQIVTTTGLVDAGRPGHPEEAVALPANTVRIGHAFIDDIARNAQPVVNASGNLLADADTIAGNAVPFNPQTGRNLQYDDELLNAHYVAGDGRINENIGLTAVHEVFHAEHNNFLADLKQMIQDELNNGDISFAAEWVLPGVDLTPAADGTPHVIQANEWNGERLFQAAKFGTETQYQHLVFEEFARKVAPTIHLFPGANINLDPAITAEFANVVYRFGHSMLDENVNIYQMGADGKPVLDADGHPIMTQIGLIDAFTNPLAYASNPNAAADLILGSVNQVGNEIDEFVTGTLRNNLLGTPLDLPALNIARGRETGVSPLNLVRNQLFSLSQEAQLRPYVSWADFGGFLKHPESLVNFIAAYGTHTSITSATTLAAKRAAAQALVDGAKLGSPTFNVDAYNFLNSQGAYANNKNDPRAIHVTVSGVSQVPTWSTGSVTGLDQVDMWIGGLAEKQSLFGGLLGSTFEFIFRTQLEALQDGDRLYYLPRLEGMDFDASIEDNSFAAMIRENTGIKHLPGSIFLTPEYTVEASDYVNYDANGNFLSIKDPGNANNTWLRNPQTGKLLVNIHADGTVEFVGDDNLFGNTIVLGGTEGNDRLLAGMADDDTIWGDGGNDILDGNGGNDILYGNEGNDTLIGNQGDDILHGDEGNDTLNGGDGLDLLFGSDGNDFIDSGRGDDAVRGGLGDDILIGGEGDDEMLGDKGDDWLEGGTGGDVMFGDSGAPTGQTPLYNGNDVLISGPDGGDRMQGFNGDDIILGYGSFNKFDGGLGFDWASYEKANGPVDADMTRGQLIVVVGADTIRDVFQQTEGLSGSAFSDILKGTDDTALTVTRNNLNNASLINGLSGFFAPGPVLFDGGNIILGGAGSDQIIGGAGNDIMDGDAWLHVSLSQRATGGQIIRDILYDPNGNTYDPFSGTGHVSAANVDIAVFNDIMANYDVALFGPDAQGFLTITHRVPAAGGGGGGVNVVIDDGTDLIRNVERLQFADATVAIDRTGFMISSSFNPIADPNYGALYAPYYDAVPFGRPVVTETTPDGLPLDPTVAALIGNTFTANVAGISDYDGFAAGESYHYQWQMQDLTTDKWLSLAGATSQTYTATNFVLGSPLRVLVSWVDGKGYTEQVASLPTIVTTLPGTGNTAPFVEVAQQFNGIASTSFTINPDQAFDFYSPFISIFNDNQTAPINLSYSATLANGQDLSTVGLSFVFNETGAGEGHFHADAGALSTPGPISVRVKVTDPGGLSATNTFVINVVAPNLAPVTAIDAYTTAQNVGLTAGMGISVLANDSDPNSDAFSASLVSGPAHGTLTFNADGTFVYRPALGYAGLDSFVYRATDTAGAASANTTATINVVPVGVSITATDPANTTDVTASFTYGGPPPGPASVVLTWEESNDNGLTWTPVSSALVTPGFLSSVYHAPATAGVLLRATASFQDPANPANIVSSTSAPVRYIQVNLGDDVVAGDNGVKSIVFTGSGNDAFRATVGDGNATYNGQDGVDTYDLSATSANATVNLGAGVATSSQTGSDTLSGIENVVGGSGADTITGDATANVITGGAGNDVIDGGAGNDTLLATIGDGNDSYAGGLGTDLYDLSATSAGATVNLQTGTSASAQTGADKLSGIENVTGGAGNDTITGDGNDNVIIGSTGNDTVVGGAGNDTIISLDGDGADRYDGGTGNDTLDLSRTTVAHTVSLVLGTDVAAGVTDILVRTVINGANTINTIENVIGGAGNDSLTGDAMANRLTGGAGNDTLIGGIGADTMIGGAGNDTYTVDHAADVVVENGGEGSDTVLATANYTLAAGVEVELLRVSATATIGLTLAGNEFSHTIVGGTRSDILVGGVGNDTLSDAGAGSTSTADTMRGGLGNDTYLVTNSNDVITENIGEGTDTVSTSASYTLAAGVEVEVLKATAGVTANLTLTGNAFSHTITGGGGADNLTGGSGNDKLDGGAGADRMVGGNGNDTYVVDNVADQITEANTANAGTDTVQVKTLNNAGSGGVTITSYALGTDLENLTFIGGGRFIGTGNTLNNVIAGGAVADTLDGGVGADTLTGGVGVDTFVYTTLTNSLASAFDTITDFSSGTDKLQIGHTVVAADFFSVAIAAGTGDLATDLAAALNAGNFHANGATKVTIGSGADAGTYAVINNAGAAFDAAGDAIIRLAGAATLARGDFI